ncbi:response regulator [Reichenbachiella agarivorans]|uniref:Response regulator n=1 Tax=Reichenbachiella agarivorans TaxID=2979464 RepID=A0ABY6CPW5_9BACT|nr:response regulator [Reichenbachiella agarivorans]UXP32570.1 response regulator [Reichenbachiella agarivorans]
MTDKDNITVLYVDDEELNLFLFEKSFESVYHVVTALSGEEGLNKLENYHKKIIVVISDMRMPAMNGIEFISKAKEKFDNIAYFILTAFDYNEEIENALDKKLIHRFFTKPFDISEIQEAIDDALTQLDA